MVNVIYISVNANVVKVDGAAFGSAWKPTQKGEGTRRHVTNPHGDQRTQRAATGTVPVYSLMQLYISDIWMCWYLLVCTIMWGFHVHKTINISK